MVIQYKDIGSIFCPEAAPESDIHTSYYKTFLPSKSLRELAKWMLRKWQKEIASGYCDNVLFWYQVPGTLSKTKVSSHPSYQSEAAGLANLCCRFPSSLPAKWAVSTQIGGVSSRKKLFWWNLELPCWVMVHFLIFVESFPFGRNMAHFGENILILLKYVRKRTTL